MAVPEALLALLSRGARHGYDLKQGHDVWFEGLRVLAFGQVYSTLSRLQRDGLVQVAHTESGEGPERVLYELTTAGRERVQAWLTEPVDPGGVHAEEMVRKILAAYWLEADPEGLMARQRAVHLRRLRSLEPETTPGTPGGSALVAALAPTLLTDHARLQLDADLRWLELAAERIRRRPIPDHPQTVEDKTVEDKTAEDKQAGVHRTSDQGART